MAQFHFVEDYERLIEALVAKHPIDQAMALAVGGSYEGIGAVELDILRAAGLAPGLSLLDLGCGSGRLAHALGKSGLAVQYTGVDIIQRLLDYAVTRSPRTYRFLLHRALDIPAADASLDMLSAFSVFTHLLQHEILLYMKDSHRCLRPGGKLVFSFLELVNPDHWNTFLVTAESSKTQTVPHLNSFLERTTIALMAERLGYAMEAFVDASQAVASAGALGQTTAVLRRI